MATTIESPAQPPAPHSSDKDGRVAERHDHQSGANTKRALLQNGEYHCTGYYVQRQSKYAMTFTATFSGASASAISGSGHDAFGQFSIEGQRTASGIEFKKHYSRYHVDYKEMDVGEFSFVLDRVTGKAQPVESAKWSGHYQQWSGSYPTSFQLHVYASGRFDGGGSDDAGEFTVEGLFVDGSRGGSFHFTKQYKTHAISYRGERRGDVITGEYESAECGMDAFAMEKERAP